MSFKPSESETEERKHTHKLERTGQGKVRGAGGVSEPTAKNVANPLSPLRPSKHGWGGGQAVCAD